MHHFNLILYRLLYSRERIQNNSIICRNISVNTLQKLEIIIFIRPFASSAIFHSIGLSEFQKIVHALSGWFICRYYNINNACTCIKFSHHISHRILQLYYIVAFKCTTNRQDLISYSSLRCFIIALPRRRRMGYISLLERVEAV